MRSWIYQKMVADTAITDALGGASKVYSAGAVQLPGTSDLIPPFAVIRALPTTPALDGAEHDVTRMPYYIWVHDQPGSFEDVIATVLTRLRAILPTRDYTALPGGQAILECKWEGDSSDQFDQVFGTAVRWGQYLITARR